MELGHDILCPLCGRNVDRDHKGRLDCPAGHRFSEPDLWREARILHLIAEIQQFLHPDSAPQCSAHRWVVTEVHGEFVAARCEFCPALGVAVAPPASPGAQPH
jgi:hypothetical protein